MNSDRTAMPQASTYLASSLSGNVQSLQRTSLLQRLIVSYKLGFLWSREWTATIPRRRECMYARTHNQDRQIKNNITHKRPFYSIILLVMSWHTRWNTELRQISNEVKVLIWRIISVAKDAAKSSLEYKKGRRSYQMHVQIWFTSKQGRATIPNSWQPCDHTQAV